jgi:hypothetical protein
MDYEFILKAAAQIQLKYVNETWGNFCLVADSKTVNNHANDTNQAELEGVRLRENAKALLSLSDKRILDQILEEQSKLIPENGNTKKTKGWKNVTRRIVSFIGRF